jgi:hypothetical protein
MLRYNDNTITVGVYNTHARVATDRSNGRRASGDLRFFGVLNCTATCSDSQRRNRCGTSIAAIDRDVAGDGNSATSKFDLWPAFRIRRTSIGGTRANRNDCVVGHDYYSSTVRQYNRLLPCVRKCRLRSIILIQSYLYTRIVYIGTSLRGNTIWHTECFAPRQFRGRSIYNIHKHIVINRPNNNLSVSVVFLG